MGKTRIREHVAEVVNVLETTQSHRDDKHAAVRALYTELISAFRADRDSGTVSALEELLRVLPDNFSGSSQAQTEAESRATAASWGNLPQPLFNDFVGRAKELGVLTRATSEPNGAVVTVVAEGGAGKTTLISRWLSERLPNDSSRKCHVFSFYGTRERKTWSTADLLTELESSLGRPSNSQAHSQHQRIRGIVEDARRDSLVLILDGIEVLQAPPGPHAGRIQDPLVRTLVQDLAKPGPVTLVLTSRMEVSDLTSVSPERMTKINLAGLPDADGAMLLRSLGVVGSDARLRNVSRAYAGHPLSLTLLGSYLKAARGGDCTQIPYRTPIDRRESIGAHVATVVQHYREWLTPPASRQFLDVLGLMSEPVSLSEIISLVRGKVHTGLNDQLHSTTPVDFRRICRQLCGLRLVAWEGNDHDVVETHLLIRDECARRMKEESPSAWKEGQRRLFRTILNSIDGTDAGLPTSQVLAGIGYGCEAGEPSNAWTKLFEPYVAGAVNLGGFRFYGDGRVGATLVALTHFFSDPWTTVADGLTAYEQAKLLDATALCLRAVGQLGQSIVPCERGYALRKSSLKQSRRDSTRIEAARSAIQLALLWCERATPNKALAYASEAVELALEAGPERDVAAYLRVRGYARALAKDAQGAQSDFNEASELAERLVSDGGARSYGWSHLVYDFWICRAEGSLVVSSIERDLAIALGPNPSLIDAGLLTAHLAIARMQASGVAPEVSQMEEAEILLRTAEREDQLPYALLASGHAHKARGELLKAREKYEQVRTTAIGSQQLLVELRARAMLASVSLDSQTDQTIYGHHVDAVAREKGIALDMIWRGPHDRRHF
jgi:tetratricopeptide (TPR) repeat protein